MNALFINDPYPFGKIAVRILILIFVTAVFSGDNLYFWGKTQAEALNAEKYSSNTEIKNFENNDLNVRNVQKELWNSSLKKRYGNAPVRKVADGIVHIRFTKKINGYPVKINVAEINPNINSNIEIQPVLAGENLAEKATVRTISKKNNSTVAVNGSYFMPKSGIPLGLIMIDKKILTGPIYNRVALGITDNGFEMGRVSLDAKLTYGENILTVDNINVPRMLSSDVIVYDKNWGKNTPSPNKNCMIASVADGKILKTSSESTEIPENGFAISGPQEKLTEFLKQKEIPKKILKKAEQPQIILDIKTNPDWENVRHIISGGPYLVKNGNLYVDIKEQKFTSIAGKNPRTAVGYTKEGYFIIAVIDGRTKSSVGLNIYDLAKLMKNLGCYNAMNLDGGSSTVMQINGAIMNSPAVNGGIAVSNALTVNISEKLAQK